VDGVVNHGYHPALPQVSCVKLFASAPAIDLIRVDPFIGFGEDGALNMTLDTVMSGCVHTSASSFNT
jgi:hypothetical protein